MRYLFIGVLLTVDYGLRDPSLEKQTGVPTPEQRNTVLWTGRKTYFSHLKERLT